MLESTFLPCWFNLCCLTSFLLLFFSFSDLFYLRLSITRQGKAYLIDIKVPDLSDVGPEASRPGFFKGLLSSWLDMVLNIVSFNVHGLNHTAKRSLVWKEALEFYSDILCIKETHFLTSNTPAFQHKKYPHVFMALALWKQQGILIAIKDSVAFVPQEIQADPEGRYLILVGKFGNQTYTFVNLYCMYPIPTNFALWRECLTKLQQPGRGPDYVWRL